MPFQSLPPRVADDRWRAARLLVSTLVPALLVAGCAAEPDLPAQAASTTSSSSSLPAAAEVTTTSAALDAAAAPPPTTVPSLSSSVATSPEELTPQLVDAERTIRDDGASPDSVAEAGRMQQLIYRVLGVQPELADAVVAAVPDELRPFVENDLAAARAHASAAARRTQPPPSTLPAWTIRDPLPIEDLRGYYAEAESQTGVPWYVLAAINLAETRMGRIDGVSSAGAVGPMQFLPTTWTFCCTGDVLADRDAIIGAATYLAQSGAPADVTAALYQYNPSDTYVEAVSRYSENMRLDEHAYRGYHAWEVFVTTSAGAVRLPVGYSAPEPIDAAAHLTEHPADRA